MATENEHIRTSCERRGIEAIYHYTLLQNLPSIFEHRGILSKTERERNGIMCEEHNWGTTSRAKELCNYVACSLEPAYGMIQRELNIGNLVLCRIKASLIWQVGTLFCPAWSSFGEFTQSYLKQHSNIEDFNSMFPNPNSSEPRFLGAEILVNNVVPLSFINSVYFATAEARDWAVPACIRVIERIGRVGVTIAFIVRPEVFKRPPDLYSKRKRYKAVM